MSKTEIILYIIGAIMSSSVIVKLIDIIEKRCGKRAKKAADREKLLNKLSSEIDNLSEFKPELEKLKLEQKRTNLMLLISTHPNSGDIPKQGEEYVSMGGNSYMLTILEQWFTERNLELPEWLTLAINETKGE